MKQIKFRVWHKEGAYMMPVEEIDFENKLINKSGAWRWFNELVLMQYTGLKGKNGVEIFEGDIVAIENHPFQKTDDSDVGMEINGNYEVGWNADDLTWCAGSLLLARVKNFVRVIGNIYENPDLLEEEK